MRVHVEVGIGNKSFALALGIVILEHVEGPIDDRIRIVLCTENHVFNIIYETVASSPHPRFHRFRIKNFGYEQPAQLFDYEFSFILELIFIRRSGDDVHERPFRIS